MKTTIKIITFEIVNVVLSTAVTIPSRNTFLLSAEDFFKRTTIYCVEMCFCMDTCIWKLNKLTKYK